MKYTKPERYFYKLSGCLQRPDEGSLLGEFSNRKLSANTRRVIFMMKIRVGQVRKIFTFRRQTSAVSVSTLVVYFGFTARSTHIQWASIDAAFGCSEIFGRVSNASTARNSILLANEPTEFARLIARLSSIGHFRIQRSTRIRAITQLELNPLFVCRAAHEHLFGWFSLLRPQESLFSSKKTVVRKSSTRARAGSK